MIPILVTATQTIPQIFQYVGDNAFGGEISFALIFLAVLSYMIFRAGLGWGTAVITGFILFFGLFVTNIKDDIFTALFAASLMLLFGFIGFAMLYFSRRG